MEWYVYILKCKDDSYYTGITKDVQKRIEAHNKGKAAKYTKSRAPFLLIYKEKCANHSEALKRENKIKKMKKIQKNELIHKTNYKNFI